LHQSLVKYVKVEAAKGPPKQEIGNERLFDPTGSCTTSASEPPFGSIEKKTPVGLSARRTARRTCRKVLTIVFRCCEKFAMRGTIGKQPGNCKLVLCKQIGETAGQL
jgi:hypothetical protein